MNPTLRSHAAGIVRGAALTLAILSAAGASAADAKAGAKSGNDAAYAKERAECEAGRTGQDKATCLKEAGAALDERRRHRLDNSGSLPANATDRCNAVPAKDKADCLARVQGSRQGSQKTTTSGSVSGGGVIKETTTTMQGTPTPVPASAPKN